MTIDLDHEKKLEVHDIKIRFRTTQMTGLIFLAKSQEVLDTLELGLEAGQVRIKIMIGHYEKEIMIGQSLNDDIWHSISFKRQGNVIEANVDDEEPKKGKNLIFHKSL